MVLVIIILPFFSATDYSIVSNSTSQLGAQLTKNAWIMNSIFILMGIMSVVFAFEKLGHFFFHKGLILIFGLSLIASAYFRHSPIDLMIPYNRLYDQYHSIFSSITGFSFVLFAMSCIFITDKLKHKVFAFSIAISTSLLSILMFFFDDYKGLLQRLMFSLAFLWLYIFLSALKNKRSTIKYLF